MINVGKVKRYCRDDFSKIENYDKAIADKKKWVCHHRLETTLDGDDAHSVSELKRMGMYYNRPYFELIFLSTSDHRKIHMTPAIKAKLAAAKLGVNNPRFGKEPWNKGLTKETDERVANYGIKEHLTKQMNRY